jgi:hypothetical protein
MHTRKAICHTQGKTTDIDKDITCIQGRRFVTRKGKRLTCMQEKRHVAGKEIIVPYILINGAFGCLVKCQMQRVVNDRWIAVDDKGWIYPLI